MPIKRDTQTSECPEIKDALAHGVRRLIETDAPRLRRLWAYYRNPSRDTQLLDTTSSDRPYRQAQEWGLPARITGNTAGTEVFDASPSGSIARKEVVIENDIGWRIDTMIDYLFGKPIVINSQASDPVRRDMIEKLLREILAAHGGIVFLQELALLGAVYGSVDVLVKFDTTENASQLIGLLQHLGEPAAHARPAAVAEVTSSDTTPAALPPSDELLTPDAGIADVSPTAGQDASLDDSNRALTTSKSMHDVLARLARLVRFEIVEPARALPLLDPADCTKAIGFATVYHLPRVTSDSSRSKLNWLSRWLGRVPIDPDRTLVIDVVTADRWTRYEDWAEVDSGENSLGRLPLVHIQNTASPLSFNGQSDVEPLMPIQDELNTRLSDRAHRLALTSVKMYLGKGIENFASLPIGPGMMWSTDNMDASIHELGGSMPSTSEDGHIAEIREAMDKLSGVSPVAAGAVKGRIGHLTSAVALRVTLQALISRTERKRTTYGVAIASLCELALAWLDKAGVFKTTEAERRIHITWPNPAPASETDRLDEAKAKISIGIPRETVLRELGY